MRVSCETGCASYGVELWHRYKTADAAADGRRPAPRRGAGVEQSRFSTCVSAHPGAPECRTRTAYARVQYVACELSLSLRCVSIRAGARGRAALRATRCSLARTSSRARRLRNG